MMHSVEHGDREAEGGLPLVKRFGFWFPLAVYALSRVFVAVAAVVLSKHQIALPIGIEQVRIAYPTPPDPGYWAVMSNWDGQWYRVIAEQGYPATLPRLADGRVDLNPWAFFPVFPYLTAGLMKVTGLPFIVAGPLLSTVLGLLAMWALFRLVDRAVGRFEAIVAVVATCFYMASPVFSASYTESAGLLLITVIIMLLRARRYAWVVPALLVLSLTRNVVIAMAPVIIAHAVVRWRQGDEGERPVRLRMSLGLLAAYAVALTWLWPAIVGVATGVPDGYNQTMMAWRISVSIKLGNWWNLLYVFYGIWGQVLGVVAVAAFAWFMLSRHSWRWGPEIWGWAGGYAGYVLLVTSPTPSRIRYALLAFPMALIIAWVLQRPHLHRWRWWLLAVIVLVGAYLMWWWTGNHLIIDDVTDDLYP